MTARDRVPVPAASESTARVAVEEAEKPGCSSRLKRRRTNTRGVCAGGVSLVPRWHRWVTRPASGNANLSRKRLPAVFGSTPLVAVEEAEARVARAAGSDVESSPKESSDRNLDSS
jgi:hypothetical protein